jgi:predicted dehydrogenase
MLLEEMGHKVSGFDLGDRISANKLKDFDAVFICSPNQEHLSHAVYCIEAKVPFFCEKPLCPTSRDAHFLGSFLVKNELVNMVACNIRFTDEYKYLKSAIQNIGQPLYTIAEFGYYLPYWRQGDYRNYYSAYKMSGGGILLDAIHEFDYLFDLFGPLNKPNTVLLSKYENTGELAIETEDNASTVVVMPNGNIIFIHLDYLQRTYKRQFTCVGTKGRVEVVFNVQDCNQMYRAEMRHFLDSVKTKTETCNPVYKHLQVLDFVEFLKNRPAKSSSDNPGSPE